MLVLATPARAVTGAAPRGRNGELVPSLPSTSSSLSSSNSSNSSYPSHSSSRASCPASTGGTPPKIQLQLGPKSALQPQPYFRHHLPNMAGTNPRRVSWGSQDITSGATFLKWQVPIRGGASRGVRRTRATGTPRWLAAPEPARTALLIATAARFLHSGSYGSRTAPTSAASRQRRRWRRRRRRRRIPAREFGAASP